MKSLLIAVVLGTVALTGCEAGESPIDPPPSTGATLDPTSAPSAGATEPASRFVLAPGKAGPFSIGMTSEQALEQGLVREPGDNECGLTPVGTYRGFSVQFADVDGEDVLFGVLIKSAEPKTTEGIGVGDSISELKETYGSKLKPTTGEFGETSHVLTDGDQAIGFVEGEGDDSGKIFAIDVFRADSPVIWDGC